MSHFNQPNWERKNCASTTKCKRLLEMCIVQHVEMKSVFTPQPIKWLVSMTVKRAKPAVTFRIFLLRTKNRQICCLAVTVHIALQERWVATTKKKNHLNFWRSFSANHNQAHSNLNQKRLIWAQIWNKLVRFLLVDDLSNIFFFQIIFFNFNTQSTVTQFTVNLQKNIIFSVSNDGIQWTLVFLPDTVTFAVNDLVQKKQSAHKNTPIVSEARFSGYSPGTSANQSEPRRNKGDERRSTLQCGGSRLGH